MHIAILIDGHPKSKFEPVQGGGYEPIPSRLISDKTLMRR
jgi:hypothetical protein